MDQSVTIDGQRVLLNGEPVAEALGDFSVRVLALAIATRSTVDWFNAPEGAEFYSNGYFYKLVPSGVVFFNGRGWSASLFGLDELESHGTYEPRPAQLDHVALPTVRPMPKFNSGTPMPLVKPARVAIDHQVPTSDYEKIAAHLASGARTAEKPAPADLLVKAREYYPNDEGLLRLYAEMRGYSCQQVEEAIDHAKRL